MYRWNRLLVYNVSVIFFKTFFQIPGCIFVDEMKNNACWLIRLFGIACINNFSLPDSLLGEWFTRVSQKDSSTWFANLPDLFPFFRILGHRRRHMHIQRRSRRTGLGRVVLRITHIPEKTVL